MKGFKYVVNGRMYFVNFKHFNNRIVKCYLYDYDLDRLFIGLAKLNIPAGDIYDEKSGEDTALDKALEKRGVALELISQRMVSNIEDQCTLDELALRKKYDREQMKYQKYMEKMEEKRQQIEEMQAEQEQAVAQVAQETQYDIKIEEEKVQ